MAPRNDNATPAISLDESLSIVSSALHAEIMTAVLNELPDEKAILRLTGLGTIAKGVIRANERKEMAAVRSMTRELKSWVKKGTQTEKTVLAGTLLLLDIARHEGARENVRKEALGGVSAIIEMRERLNAATMQEMRQKYRAFVRDCSSRKFGESRVPLKN